MKKISLGQKCDEYKIGNILPSERVDGVTSVRTAAVIVVNCEEIWIAENTSDVFCWKLKEQICVGKLNLEKDLPQGQFVTCMAQVNENEVRRSCKICILNFFFFC